MAVVVTKDEFAKLVDKGDYNAVKEILEEFEVNARFVWRLQDA